MNCWIGLSLEIVKLYLMYVKYEIQFLIAFENMIFPVSHPTVMYDFIEN